MVKVWVPLWLGMAGRSGTSAIQILQNPDTFDFRDLQMLSVVTSVILYILHHIQLKM